MKITDISTDRNEVQPLEILSDNEAIKIVGGDRGGPSDGCPPMYGHAGGLSSIGEIKSHDSEGDKILRSLNPTIRKYLYQSNET